MRPRTEFIDVVVYISHVSFADSAKRAIPNANIRIAHTRSLCPRPLQFAKKQKRYLKTEQNTKKQLVEY